MSRRSKAVDIHHRHAPGHSDEDNHGDQHDHADDPKCSISYRDLRCRCRCEDTYQRVLSPVSSAFWYSGRVGTTVGSEVWVVVCLATSANAWTGSTIMMAVFVVSMRGGEGVSDVREEEEALIRAEEWRTSVVVRRKAAAEARSSLLKASLLELLPRSGAGIALAPINGQH